MTVTTQEALERALKSKETHIRITSTLAETIKSKIQKRRKHKKIGALIAIGGTITLAIATGGTSLIGGAAGLTAMGVTAGGLTITAGELAIIIGGSVAITALLKGYKKISFNPDGSIELEK